MNFFLLSEGLYSTVQPLYWLLLVVVAACTLIENIEDHIWGVLTVVVVGCYLMFGGIKGGFGLSSQETFAALGIYLAVGFGVSILLWRKLVMKIRHAVMTKRLDCILEHQLPDNWFTDPNIRVKMETGYTQEQRIFNEFQKSVKNAINSNRTQHSYTYSAFIESITPSTHDYGSMLVWWIGFWPVYFLNVGGSNLYDYVMKNIVGLYGNQARNGLKDLA